MGHCCGSDGGLWDTAVGMMGIVRRCCGSDGGLWDTAVGLMGDCGTLLWV